MALHSDVSLMRGSIIIVLIMVYYIHYLVPTIVSPHSIIGASKTQYTSDYDAPCKLPKLSCTGIF